ncbi:MAG: amidohydrolase [Phascolarctobacterium sp.]|nr:amidohydrolase [Candidatus Phascolarctobacterium caballi]
MKYDVAVKNVYLPNGDNKTVANIGINGNKIVYIGKEEISGTEEINGKDMLAVPGWVNTHTHLAMTLFRSYADDMELMPWLQEKIWPIEAKMQREHFKWGSYLGVVEMIKNGTTCFNDMYFVMEETAKAVDEGGLRAVLSRCVMGDDPKDDYRMKESLDFYKEWNDKANGRIKVAYGPHAPYTCTDRYLKKVVEYAKQDNVLLHIHLAETAKEVEDCAARSGKSPIALMESLGLFELPTVAAHCVYVDKNDRQILAKNNVAVAHNPQSNLKLASGIAPVTDLLDDNVLVTVGTDGCSSNNNLDMLEEVRLACYLAKGTSHNPTAIPAQQALEIGTYNGAKALQFDKLGKLEEGYIADIVLYNMSESYWYPRHNFVSNLIYAASSNDVDTVIVDGKVLMKKREILTLDEEKIKFETNKIALELTK